MHASTLPHLPVWRLALTMEDSTRRKIELTHLVESATAAAYELTARATFTGALQTPNGPVPPNGSVITLAMCQFLTVERMARSPGIEATSTR
jgi:hypothetical protein